MLNAWQINNWRYTSSARASTTLTCTTPCIRPFLIYTGKARKDSQLNKDQREQKLSSTPGILEYFSYMFTFQFVFVGPSCTFKEYKAFVDGSNLRPPASNGVAIASSNVRCICMHVYTCNVPFPITQGVHVRQKLLDEPSTLVSFIIKVDALNF